jgi:D-apionolactonase
MSDEAERLRLYGTIEAPTQWRLIECGPLCARFEAGNLRYILYDGVEMLRAVSYVVRDRDWGTLKPEITGLRVDGRADGFSIRYDATCAGADAMLRYAASIEGDRRRVVFRVDATPDGAFETNRCGFTVLHPIDGVAGRAVTVEHCDGAIEETVFPELIEPWQPFKDIRALTHRPEPHLAAECRMEGDAFEMEDQRNWSDASYKTYVRPLALPWPYRMPAGVTDRQSVSLTITDKRPSQGGMGLSTRAAPPAVVKLAPGAPDATRLPEIGLVVTPDEVGDALRHPNALKTVAPQSILCHYDPTAGHGSEALSAFASLQTVYPARYDLECVVAATGDLDDEMRAVAAMVRESGLELASVAVCPSVDRQSTPPGSAWPDCPPLEDVYRAARSAFPRLPLGGGMFSYFTELNRKRPPVDMLDFVTHATNPIVHAADDDHVMETLEALPHITRSARAIIGADRAYRLGPSSIGMRQNPYGSRTMDNPDRARLCMASDDPRQRGRFAAAWTAGYAARIAPAGIAQWVPCAFSGPRGLLDHGSGDLLPVGRVVAACAKHAGKPYAPYVSGDERKVLALGCMESDGPHILVANLTGDRIRLDCHGHHELEPFGVGLLHDGKLQHL